MTNKLKNGTLTDLSSQESKCSICNGEGFIYTEDEKGYLRAKECKCTIKKRMIANIERSGLKELFKTKTFESFEATTQKQQQIKNKCIENVKVKNSILLMGQVGSGKTHLAIAIMRELAIQGKYIKYINAVEELMELSQLAMDNIAYQQRMGILQSAENLMIDDLFKGIMTESQKKNIYTLINARYNNNKKTIITTELNPQQMLNVDEAIASRIMLMAKDYILQMDGLKNYRLKK